MSHWCLGDSLRAMVMIISVVACLCVNHRKRNSNRWRNGRDIDNNKTTKENYYDNVTTTTTTITATITTADNSTDNHHDTHENDTNSVITIWNIIIITLIDASATL